MSDHPSPLQRLGQLIREEKPDIVVLITYTAVIGLLSLAVPLATQTLVNTIALGIFVQPLVVLSVIVFVVLIAAGLLQLLQWTVVETLQQRVFASTALKLADRLVKVKTSALRNEYGPELVNRFFDVVTVQKALAKLLLDSFTAMLQTVVGLILLAFYHPLLLGVDLLMLTGIAFVLLVLGYNGLRTSIQESREKYAVADWLEEMARAHVGLKIHASAEYLATRADNSITRYVKARRDHYRVTLRQATGHYVLMAVASASVLAAGGWLVITGKLSLGQLVASQIIVGSVLAAVEKLVRQSDQFFDLLTGLDKVGHVVDLPQERLGGKPLLAGDPRGAAVSCRGVRFSYRPDTPVLESVDLFLAPGERVSLVGASGTGKSTLVSLICGLEEPSQGTIEIDGAEIREVDLQLLRSKVGVVGQGAELVDGTIEENITLGRSWVGQEDLRWAVEKSGLREAIARLPGGMSTQIVSGGGNLSRGQAQRVLIARAIVGRPRLLILDEALTGIDERISGKILDALFDPGQPWTILDISHDAEVIMRTSRVHVLNDGLICETGAPEALLSDRSSAMSQLFPHLTRPISQAAKPKRTRKVEVHP